MPANFKKAAADRLQGQGSAAFDSLRYEDDAIILQRLIHRVRNIYHPTVASLSDQNIWNQQGYVDIGLLSNDVNIADFHSGPSINRNFYQREDFRSVVTLDNKIKDKETNHMLDAVGAHLSRGCKFICGNEFGVPAISEVAPAKFIKGGTKLAVGLRKLASQNQAIIIPGTYASQESRTNEALLFNGLANRARESAALSHRKLNSALKLKERIRGRNDNVFKCYTVGDITFTIMICMDAYDLSFFSRIVKMNIEQIVQADSEFDKDWEGDERPINRKDPKIQFIFVPSYSKNDGALYEVCKDLSYLSGAVVIFVNFAGCSSRNDIFLRGESLWGIQATANRSGVVEEIPAQQPIFRIFRSDLYDSFQKVNQRMSPFIQRIFSREGGGGEFR